MPIKTIPIISDKPNAEDNNDTPAQKGGDGIPNGAFVHDVINANANELTELKNAYIDGYVLHCQLYPPTPYQDDRWIITPSDYLSSVYNPTDLVSITGWSVDDNTVNSFGSPVQIDHFGELFVNNDGTIFYLSPASDSITGAFTLYIHYTVSGQPRKVPALITVNAS